MFRSERIEDRTALGVEDPLDESASVDGRGTRVIMKDASGRTMADIIVGHKVEDTRDTSDLMRQPKEWAYMRKPDGKRIYAVNMRPSMESRGELIDKISTHFNEWIDTDLLQVDRMKIKKLLVQNYSVDESSGTLKDREVITLTLDKDKKWQIDGLGEEEQVKETATRQLASAIDSLKIEGVRPQPDTLNAMSLASKGFFVGKDGGLFGNEGQMAVYTEDGIIYHLFFGEVLMGSGKAVTAGVEEGAETGDEDKTVATENRYVFVRVQLDPDLEKEFAEAKAAFDEEQKNKPAEEEVAAADEGDEPEEKEKSEVEKKYDELKEKLDGARERMDELNLRFNKWYYVISGNDFDKVNLGRSDLVELKLPDTSKIGEQPEEPREPVKRPSGLGYVDLARGEGMSAWDGDTVKVLYTGWLKDGSEFDSNQDRENPFSFVLGEGQVIKGWDEGVRGMSKGGKRKLLVPPELGYGMQGAGEKIPPKAFLVFDVELLDIIKKATPPPTDGGK
jgi:hypothetical protein